MTTGNFFSIFPQIVLEAPWKQLQPFSICQLQGLASPEKLQKRPSPSHRWEEGHNTSITREEQEVGGSATSAFKQNKQKVNQNGFSPNIYKTQAWVRLLLKAQAGPGTVPRAGGTCGSPEQSLAWCMDLLGKHQHGSPRLFRLALSTFLLGFCHHQHCCFHNILMGHKVFPLPQKLVLLL